MGFYRKINYFMDILIKIRNVMLSIYLFSVTIYFFNILSIILINFSLKFFTY